MSELKRRDAQGRFLPSEEEHPNELWYSTRDVRMRRATIEAFKKLDADGWTGSLFPEHRQMVEERVQELTGGKYAELSPALRSLVLGIARDEILELSIESEVYGSKSRRLVNKKTGKIAAWIPELVKLRDSLDKRREKLEKALGELEPKRPVSLAAYLESRERAGIANSPEGGSTDGENGISRPDEQHAYTTPLHAFSADAESCAECGEPMPPRARGGGTKKYCKPKCRWKAAAKRKRDT